MRKAAGVILIALGAYAFISSVVFLILSSMHGGSGLYRFVFAMVYGAFVVAGGVFCLKRKYWGACLISGLIVVLDWIVPVVEALARGSNLGVWLLMNWVMWIVVVGAVVSIIFIIRRKKEWQEISDSVHSEVSKDG